MVEMLVYLPTMLIALRILLTIVIVPDCLRIRTIALVVCMDLLNYHWWDKGTVDWYGPILRIGGAEVPNACYGQFISMHSRIDMSYHTLGSRISKN